MFLLIGHQRSGTHFLWHVLKSNFDIDLDYKLGMRYIHHKYDKISDPEKDKLIRPSYPIYVLRDARDVLVSSYYFYKDSDVLSDENSTKNISFSEFIRGRKIDTERDDIQDMMADPVTYWCEHTKWIESFKLFIVHYEDLKNRPITVIKNIGICFGIPLKHTMPIRLTKLVAPKYRKGIIGDWRNHFSDTDLKYFWSKAGDRMKRLGYNL